MNFCRQRLSKATKIVRCIHPSWPLAQASDVSATENHVSSQLPDSKFTLVPAVFHAAIGPLPQVPVFHAARDPIGRQLLRSGSGGTPAFFCVVRLSGGVAVLPNYAVVASVSRAVKHEPGVAPFVETLAKITKATICLTCFDYYISSDNLLLF